MTEPLGVIRCDACGWAMTLRSLDHLCDWTDRVCPDCGASRKLSARWEGAWRFRQTSLPAVGMHAVNQARDFRHEINWWRELLVKAGFGEPSGGFDSICIRREGDQWVLV